MFTLKKNSIWLSVSFSALLTIGSYQSVKAQRFVENHLVASVMKERVDKYLSTQIQIQPGYYQNRNGIMDYATGISTGSWIASYGYCKTHSEAGARKYLQDQINEDNQIRMSGGGYGKRYVEGMRWGFNYVIDDVKAIAFRCP